MKPGATPIFARAREVPLALRDAYAKEIDAKIAAGVYEKVEFSEWASTTHVVTKKNGTIRITGNYKPTVNHQMIIDEHPIPKAEDLFNKMQGATIFAHLDVTDAYTHLTIDEEFAHVLTLNTATHGLIRPRRAVYGAANIPAIWQRKMESVIQGIPNVLNFFDDFLIFAKNFNELIKILEITLDRMKSSGLKLNKEKCIFAASSVEFLGHVIDANGIHKSQIQMLRSKVMVWSREADKAYSDIKKILVSPQVLMPYDPKLPLLLATDASNTGLGAVLSHRLDNGQERPIAYASRTMSLTERRYSQIDKEALAIVWAVQKFFKYLYARKWTLITDHKPLTQILQPDKSLPVLCISRMANYADFLSNFNFNVVYKTSKQNANADYLSRVTPQCSRIHQIKSNNFPVDAYDEFDKFIIRQIEQLPVTADKIDQKTRKDIELRKIVKPLERGCCLLKYGYKSPEANYKLSGGCLTFEHRVVIPKKFRESVLKNLHAAHLGIVKMKGIARSFVYWPKIDADIERMAKECDDCLRIANKPKLYDQHHWEYPKEPWERVHMDYAGPVQGMMLLVVTDAHNKWLDVKVTKSITAAATIKLVDEIFAAYGVPKIVVTDNGTNFSSTEFNDYLRKVGVRFHKYTAPYHPATNGQAERSVCTLKNALKAMGSTSENLRQNVNEFLRQFNNAPHSTTGISPSQLFLGRKLRTRLDLVWPEPVSSKVMTKQFLKSAGKKDYRIFNAGDNVYFQPNNIRGAPWKRGQILNRIGDVHYEIDYKGKILKRHINQIRRGSHNANENVSAESRPTCTSVYRHGNCEPAVNEPNFAENSPVINNAATNQQPLQTSEREAPNTGDPPRRDSETSTCSSRTSTSPLRGFRSPSPIREGVRDSREAAYRQTNQPPPAPRRSTRPVKRRILFSP